MEESISTEQLEEMQPLRRRAPQPKLSPRYVHQFVEQIVGEDFHAKRVLSLANGVVGVMHAAALAVHYIGQGLAVAEGLDPKHAIKQVDRLLSNQAISVWSFFSRWVPFVVAQRKALRVALDWTDFERDDQTTIALYLLTSHGRATPLVWKTVKKSELKERQGRYEDEVIERLQMLAGYTYTQTKTLDDIDDSLNGAAFNTYVPRHMLRVWGDYALSGSLERFTLGAQHPRPEPHCRAQVHSVFVLRREGAQVVLRDLGRVTHDGAGEMLKRVLDRTDNDDRLVAREGIPALKMSATSRR